MNKLFVINQKIKNVIKVITPISLLSFSVLNFTTIAIAADYIEGEEAYNDATEEAEEVINKEYSWEEVCDDERGKCIDNPNESKERIVEGIAVKRDCWKYEFIKNCNRGPSTNNCASIQQDDFKFVGDTCLNTMKVGEQSFCINIRKTFARTSVQTEEINRGRIIMDPDNKEVVKNLLCESFCLDGNCTEVFKTTQDANDEIAGAVAQLEMLSNIKKGLVEPNNLKFDVFGATVRRCHNKKLHSNCCSDNESGLFISLGFHKCSKDDAALIAERRKSKCKYVGEYCAKKILGKCIRKTKTYCCFPTILAKTIRLGASNQLGKSLGRAEHPQCGGLSLSDIERLDFGLIDFQEFFDLEVQPMMKGYNSQDNEALVKKSFTNISQEGVSESVGSQSFQNISKDGLNTKLFEDVDGGGN